MSAPPPPVKEDRMDRELYLIALRALSRLTDGCPIDKEDIGRIRAAVGPEEFAEPLDVICCLLIRRNLPTGGGAKS